MRVLPVLTILCACSTGRATLEAKRSVHFRPDMDADSDSDADGDTDTDTDADTDTDTGGDDTAIDTGDTGDTGGDTGDSGDTVDTAVDTGASCPGVTGFAQNPVYVASTSDRVEGYAEIIGCATGISVEDNGFSPDGYTYTLTWQDVPTDCDGTSTCRATFLFEGSARPTSGEFWFYFHTDQGDSPLFIVELLP